MISFKFESLFQTSTWYNKTWLGKYNGFFKETIMETELSNNFEFYYKRKGKIPTKPPIIFFENYDL